MNRHVLIIAYYFPPMGLSGVQRVAKFVKYLPLYGWRPTVLTIEPGGYFAYDTSLLNEVKQAGATIYRTSSWDPTRVFGHRQTVALPEEPHRKWLSKISQWFFIPDNKIGWMPNAVRAGTDLLEANSFDAIFSSAPPYTAHLIAERLSRISGLPLLIDFRDDWVGNPRHHYPTPWHRRMNERLERRILEASHRIITINDPIRNALRSRHPELHLDGAFSVIPQGFDPEKLSIEPTNHQPQKMRFLYSGIFYDAQTPDFFIRALAEAIKKRTNLAEHLEVVFLGLMPKSSLQLVEQLGLDGLIRYEGYVSHETAVAEQLAADVLWMTIGKRPGAEGISTGKLFEYMGTRKPILALIPPGTARDALLPYGASTIVEPDDLPAIESAILSLYDAWEKGALPQPNESHIRRFDRRHLAGQLAAYLSQSVTCG